MGLPYSDLATWHAQSSVKCTATPRWPNEVAAQPHYRAEHDTGYPSASVRPLRPWKGLLLLTGSRSSRFDAALQIVVVFVVAVDVDFQVDVAPSQIVACKLRVT